MSTLSELIAHRDTAGARYVAAVAELRAAYGDLAAIERLLENKSEKGGKQPSVGGFGGQRPDPVTLRHPKYLSGNNGSANAALVNGAFEDDVRSAFATRQAAFGTPDE